jgi:hypothetical protein
VTASGESTTARPDTSIFFAMHRAGEFYKLSRSVPAIVGTGKKGIPRPIWLRRAFGEWLETVQANYAGSQRELREQIYNLLEMAWYGILANPERRAPGWLIGWPEEIEQEKVVLAPERLDAPSTWHIEREILRQLETSIVPESHADNPPPSTRGKGSTDLFAQQLRQLVAKYPEWSNRRIFGKYDVEGGKAPVRWRIHDHREGGMVAAFDCLECKHPLESLLSRIRRKLRSVR